MARAYLREFAEEERQKQQLIILRRSLRDSSDPFSLPEDNFIEDFRLSKEVMRQLCVQLLPLLPEKSRSHAIPMELAVSFIHFFIYLLFYSFIEDFRLSKEVMRQLCVQLLPLLPEKSRSHAIPMELAIFAAVGFLASGSYQRVVGKDFHLGLSQPAVSQCLADVVDALNSAEMVQRHIHFPNLQEERIRVMRRFSQAHQVPGVLGCIDGTHVAIIKPSENEEVYFNRKNYHSLNVLVICDADLQILHADASFGGASHDAHIWNGCPIRSHLQNLHEQGEACWLLGDSGYAQREYLMTPVLGAAPGTPEENYTRMHCSARNTVERCIGVLKARWRCLLRHRTLHYNPIKAGKIVNACVVLHNMANAAHVPVPRLDDNELGALRAGQIDVAVIDANPTGREALVERLWRGRNLV